VLLSEHAFYQGEQGLIASFADRKCLGNGGHDLLNITYRGERHQEYPVSEQLTEFGSHLQA
jgi:hypothetical protein